MVLNATHCDICCEILARQAALNRRINAYVDRHWLLPDIVEIGFDKSDKVAERANLGVWRDARGNKPGLRPAMTGGEKNYYIHGPTGVGKTYLARCILMWAVELGVTAMERNMYRLLNEAADWASASNLPIEAYRIGVLLLDDVDKALYNRPTCAYLHSLIDARYNGGKLTIITSNYDTPAWAAQITAGSGNPTMAAAILERLLPIRKWAMTGASLRRKGAL